MTKRLFDSRGSMMIGALMMVFVVTLLGVALFDLAVVENRLILGSDCDVRAFYAAEAGLQVAYKMARVNWPTWFPTVPSTGYQSLGPSYTNFQLNGRNAYSVPSLYARSM